MFSEFKDKLEAGKNSVLNLYENITEYFFEEEQKESFYSNSDISFEVEDKISLASTTMEN